MPIKSRNGVWWPIEQNCPSKLLIQWGKSKLDLDRNGREIGLLVHKVGFYEAEEDFYIQGKSISGILHSTQH
jgi:hypothetical protein